MRFTPLTMSNPPGTADPVASPSSPVDSTTRNGGLRVPVWICAVMLVLYAMYFARTLVVPIVFAGFVYLTLRPIQRRLHRLRVPDAAGAILILGSLAAMTGLVAYFVYEPLVSIGAEVPRSFGQVKDKLAGVFQHVETINEVREDMTAAAAPVDGDRDRPIEVAVTQPAWDTNVTLLSGTGSALSFVTVVVVLTYFLLAYGDEVLKSWIRMLPRLSSKKLIVGSIDDIQEAVGGYLLRVSIINAVLGVCVATAMWAWGMSYPLAWGVMAFAFNYIPILGAVAGAAILFFVALLNFDTATQAALCTATFLTLTTIEGQFITPSILGKSMNVNPLLVAVALIAFGWIWGFVGVLLSVPIVIAGQMIWDNIREVEEDRLEAANQEVPDRSAATLRLPTAKRRVSPLA